MQALIRLKVTQVVSSKYMKVKIYKPRSEKQWFEIITGFKKPEGVGGSVGSEHCPNCKSIITRTNTLKWDGTTKCQTCI